MQIQTRFRFNFLANTFVPALINLGLFSTVFFGFFKTGAPSTSGLDRTDFISFTLLGSMTATLFTNAFNAFQTRFQYEKYWQTAYAMLASPLSPWAILLGITFSEAIRFSFIAFPFLVAAYILSPVSASVTLFTIVLLVLLYLMVSGFSLVRGALFLVNENLDPFFTYFVLGTAYMSCFYYPVSFVPSILQPFALINPVYFIVYLVRALWLNLPLVNEYVVAALAVAILSPAIGTYVYQKVWRNLDLTGY